MNHTSIIASLACLTFAALPVCAESAPLTIVHLTDVHMRPDFDAPKRLPHALADVRKRNPFIIKLSSSDVISVTYTGYPDPVIDNLPKKPTPPKPSIPTTPAP